MEDIKKPELTCSDLRRYASIVALVKIFVYPLGNEAMFAC